MSGFVRALANVRVLASVLLFAFLLFWLLPRLFDVPPTWALVVVVMVGAMPMWLPMMAVSANAMRDLADAVDEDEKEALEHAEKTEEPSGVPDDLSGLDDVPPPPVEDAWDLSGVVEEEKGDVHREE